MPLYPPHQNTNRKGTVMSSNNNVIQFVIPPAKLEIRYLNDVSEVIKLSTAMVKEQKDAVVSPTLRQITNSEWVDQLAALMVKHGAELARMQEKYSYWKERADQLSVVANEYLADVARILETLNQTVTELTVMVSKARLAAEVIPAAKTVPASNIRKDVLKIAAGTAIILAGMYITKKLLN